MGRLTGCSRRAGSSARVTTGGPRDTQRGRAEPVLPFADRRQHRVLFGAGRQCNPDRLSTDSWAGAVSRIASARLRLLRGHPAGRSQSAASSTPGGCVLSATDRCSRARGQVKLGRTCGRAWVHVRRGRDAQLTLRASGLITQPVAR